MEQHPTPPEGGELQATHASELQQPAAYSHEQSEPLTDAHLIHHHITKALRESRPIDHATARCIAAQLHGGQTSVLYTFASTGAVTDGISSELNSWRENETPEEIEPWLDALNTYLASRDDHGPIAGWHHLWPVELEHGSEPEPGDTEQPPFTTPAAAIGRHAVQSSLEDEAQLRHALLHRITAASVTTLGQVATIVTAGDATASATSDDITHSPTPEHPTDHHPHDQHHQDGPDAISQDEVNQDDEPDIFPWHDAAHWSPDNPDNDQARTRLEALFTETPDQELGTTHHLGWFGLLTQDGLSGGFILSQNSYGHRRVWATDSDERLAQYWEQLQSEYDAFMRATRAAQTPSHVPATQANNSEQLGHDHHNNTDTDHPHLNSRTEYTEHNERDHAEQEQTNSGHSPEIWVGSLSDYNDSHLHGTWLDATLEPDDLHLAIQFILRTGHDPTAEEWSIMDYDDFCGLRLGEYEPLEAISSIANGIAEHGEAFAKWVEYVGERSEDLLTDERFQDHYLGHFESTEAYVENLLEETGAYEFEEFVPEWLKPYVKIDVELLTRDSEIELYVAEAEDGGVFVFDGRH